VLRRSTDISKLLGAAGVTGLELFERLTSEVDSWLSLHLRDLRQKDPSGVVTKEQEQSLRKQALRERDAIFAKVCQENGIGSDLVSLASAAETLASAISKGELLADNDLDEDYDFEGRCEDLIEFKERHGHCRVPRGWRENVELSNWVRNLRRKKIRGTLSSEKIAKLEELGFVWRKERKDSWEEHFLQLIEFNERFGHCRVSRNWKENVKLGQWVQSLRRLKLSGRLSDDKIARLESIGFEWRLRQKEEGVSQDSREAYDGESDPGVASSGSDLDGYSEAEEDQPCWLRESETKRWHSIDISLIKDQSQLPFAYHDGLRAPPQPLAITTAAVATTTTTKLSATMRNKKAKARLPSAPTFSLNDIDEDQSYGQFGHETHGYLDDDDDDDAEFDAVLDDEEEDDDWEGIKTTSRSKRKRAVEKKPKSRQQHDTDRRPVSSSPAKTGVRACMECGATKTPHWRRGPSDEYGDPAFLCNACGLRYYKTLQQKPSAKSKKRSSPTKKQKTHREHDPQDEVATAATRETAADKKTSKTTKAKRPTTVTEAVTDSDSESREGIPADEATALRDADEGTEHCVKEDATGHEDLGRAGIQAAGAENTHVPWLLAFKQKRKDLQKLASASSGQPTTAAAATNESCLSLAKEEDDEIFDFVE
jgi:hypothetical protein